MMNYLKSLLKFDPLSESDEEIIDIIELETEPIELLEDGCSRNIKLIN
ncbi:hypothetical protein A3Q56_07126 [Intoshia linei]|uniref:Uncharacterized protein n=1 Tax=Intoshia linei TaxID=1819745 RepID=A0A177AT44_9BILA|nr:hypothetical protein A3Q56_07126 [Intoshia linei]